MSTVEKLARELRAVYSHGWPNLPWNALEARGRRTWLRIARHVLKNFKRKGNKQ